MLSEIGTYYILLFKSKWNQELSTVPSSLVLGRNMDSRGQLWGLSSSLPFAGVEPQASYTLNLPAWQCLSMS